MYNKSSIWTKVKQRAPVTSSNVSNENETTETSNQTIVEKHDNKKHFLWYHIKKKMEFEQTVKRLLPSNTKLLVSFTSNKLSSCFNIKDKTKFKYKHDAIYPRTCPKTKCNDNYISEAKWQISKRVKDHYGWYIKSYLLKHALENDRQRVSEKDFKIIGHGFLGNKKKKKVSEASLIWKIKPNLNIQDQGVQLQLFS